jgi:hypothetical protein
MRFKDFPIVVGHRINLGLSVAQPTFFPVLYFEAQG